METAAEIPLAMLIVFGSAKLLAELFEALHMPTIVGEIVAGIVIGPAVLGWITPNPTITALADLGVLFLLFRVGLDVRTKELLRVGGTATLVAFLGVVAPFALGWAILRIWGAPQIESVFVGAAMVATSVGITAQVLASKGLLEERASKIILAAAVIDDILGLLVLAAVSSMAREKVNLLGLLLTAVMAIGFTAIVARWGNAAAGRLFPRLEARLKSSEAEFNLAMILLFALSVLALDAGVAAIIGAFLAGMALADTVGQRVRDLTHGVTELLVPFFLAGIGLNMNLSLFMSRSLVLLAVVIIIAAVISKFIGCGLGAIRLGRADAMRVGCGMVPRGEVGMVVAQLGLSMRVIPQSVYGVVVFMAIATTLIAPLLLNVSFRGAKQGKKVEEFQIG